MLKSACLPCQNSVGFTGISRETWESYHVQHHRALKIILAQHYGAQFAGLILYGSMARQTATPESDIDLLVLLHKPFDYFREVRTIVDLLYPIQLASDRLISALPAAVDEFERGDIQLYRNAKREGVNV